MHEDSVDFIVEKRYFRKIEKQVYLQDLPEECVGQIQ
jgi:hypothetical protein